MSTLVRERFSYTLFKQHLVENKKNVFVSMMFVLAAALLLANVSLLNSSRMWRVLQLSGFILLGCFYLLKLQKNLKFSSPAEENAFTYSLSVLVFILVSGLIYFRGYYWFLIAVASTFCFLLPSIVEKGWSLFTSLFVSEHMVWQYQNGLEAKQSFVSFNNIPIRLKYLAKPTSSTETIIAFTAPARMKLGAVFFHFIEQQNEGNRKKIEYTDESGAPFFWEYYTLGLGGWSKLYLNPEKTLIENAIKPHTIIVVKRVAENEIKMYAAPINETVNN